MKTIHLTILLMVVSILIVPSVQNAKAIPYFSPQELYKLSYVVFHGEVISKQEGPGPDYYYYQIKVDTYFKNPQNSDSITVAGHKPGSPRAEYPQFEVGDKAIFYIRKIGGINTMYYGSQKAGNACDIHSFLGPAPLPGEKLAIISPASNLRLLDVNGNVIIGSVSTNHKVVLNYDDIWNSYPESRIIPVETSILDSNSQTVFYKKQNLEMQACDGPGIIKWDYVPTQSGKYTVTMIVDNKTTLSTIFEVKDDSGISSLKSILSPPLKQFKSGVKAQDVQCNEGFQLIIRNENNFPACVTPQTAKNLDQFGWGTYLSSNSVKETVSNKDKSNSSIECETKFKLRPFEHTVFPNGTSRTVNYVPVFLMKPNSTGKICTTNWKVISGDSYSGKVLSGIGKDNSTTSDISIVSYPDNIKMDDTNKTIVYTITSSRESHGFYRINPMFFDCGGLPLAVGYDSSHLFDNDFPWLWDVLPCPLNTVNVQITGLSGIDVAYIIKVYD